MQWNRHIKVLMFFIFWCSAGFGQPQQNAADGKDALVALSRGGLIPIGKLKTKPTAAIPFSRFSIGFETLDRKMFDPEKVYPHLARLGAKWARVQTGWSQCEKVKGQYDFAWLDKIVDSLRAQGVQPWFNVTYGNRLYIPAAPHETAVGWPPIFTAEAREGWVNFVKALARHYKDRVTRYEIWNEPDITDFWTPSEPSPEQYTELVKITARAIREVYPQATILGGALSQVTRLGFLEKCLKAGMAERIDALTYHVYYPNPEIFYDRYLPALRALLQRMAPKLEAWQGESGVPSLAQPGQALDRYVWTEERQAKWDARRLVLDLANGVPFIAVFSASDFMFYIVKSEIVHKRYYYGIVGGDNYEPKPAYYACQTIFNLFAGNPKRNADVQIKILAPGEVGEAGMASGTGDTSATGNTQPRAYGIDTERGMVIAVWQPTDLQKAYTPRLVNVEVRAGSGTKPPVLKDPVLIDPISQKVYKAGKFERQGEGKVSLKGIPLTDWPLLIADRGAVEITE